MDAFSSLARYSTTSVYTEMRDGTRDGDDGSRILTIENHLGVTVTITLEDNVAAAIAEAKALAAGLGRRKREKRTE